MIKETLDQHRTATPARTEADAVAEIAAARGRGPHVLSVAERQTIVTLDKDGRPTFTSARTLLQEYDARPRRRRGTASFADLPSFVAHANRFKGESSALFASSEDGPELISVLDYHDAGPSDPVDLSARAQWGQHRGLYRFPLSEEWRAWTGLSARGLDQTAFAEFLETRIADVIDPKRAGEGLADLVQDQGLGLASPSRILELSKGLTVRVNSRVAAAVVLASGESQLSYATEHQDDKGQPLKVPTAFAIAIPVFERGDVFQFLVRLRYRVVQSSVTWILSVHNTERALAVAFEEACTTARDETGLPLFFGAPEE